MVVLWITFLLYIPIFKGSDDVGCVCCPKLKFDYVAPICAWILKQKIESARTRLPFLSAPELKVAK